MKIKWVIVVVLFPLFTNGQSVLKPDSVLTSFLNELKESWTLGVDSKSSIVDINMYNKYKRLFDTNAIITDDFDVRYVPGKDSGNYIMVATPKEFDLYAHDVALQLTRITVDSVVEISRKYFSRDSIIVEMKRKVHAEKRWKYVFSDIYSTADKIISFHPDNEFEKKKGKVQDSDREKRKAQLVDKMQLHADDMYMFDLMTTMRITIAYTLDDNAPLTITGIKNTTNSLLWSNDNDGDGIINEKDKSPDEYGSFTTGGTPDSDLDAVPNSADKCTGSFGIAENYGCPASYFTNSRQAEGFLGIQYNSIGLNLPELNNLGYKDEAGADAMDVLQSSKGEIKKPGTALGIVAGGSFAFYFGKGGKQIGLSLGVNYATYTSGYELTEPVVYTYKAFDGNDYYRRQISINNLKEEMAFNIINLPVQLSYRFKPFANKKWLMNIKVGPSFLLIKNSSDYNATVDFGGIYQVDTISKSRITYYPFLNPNSTYNVYITSSAINNQNSNPGAPGVFAQLAGKGYDFAANKNFRDKQQLTRNAIAFNLSLSGQYRKNKDNPLALQWGLHGVYAPIKSPGQQYKPIEKTTDSFNSIFNTSGKSSYMAYGVHLGAVYHL